MYSDIIKKLKKEAITLTILSVAVFITAAVLRYLVIPSFLDMQEKRLEYRNYLGMISSENGYQTIKTEITAKNGLLQKPDRYNYRRRQRFTRSLCVS